MKVKRPLMTSLLSFLVILSGLCLTDRTGRSADKGPAAPAGLLIDLQDNRTIEEDKWSSELTEYDILLIGEEHRQKSHHQAQLDIIRNLKIFSGRSLAIGLEMFRIDHQKILDKWVKGEIDEVAFLEAYYTNWHYDWHLYRDIFIYARVYHLPLIALNAPRGISNQVAMAGFDSLSPEQRGQLPELSCNVDQRYMDFIRKAYGRHPHGKMNFTFFCEARLLRDTTMAITALTYLESCPQHQMIILTGRGHALKSGGILQQIKSRSNLSCAVILPETDTSALKRLSGKDANYIHISQKQPAAKH